MTHHIMIVEDDGTQRMVAETILKKLGYKVTALDNAFSGLAKMSLAPEEYDLILMDWEIPSMNGLEAVKNLRETQLKNDWPHIPVIAFTGNKQPGDKEKCLDAGMDDYLAKEIFMPKWSDLLSEKLNHWLPIK